MVNKIGVIKPFLIKACYSQFFQCRQKNNNIPNKYILKTLTRVLCAHYRYQCRLQLNRKPKKTRKKLIKAQARISHYTVEKKIENDINYTEG